MARDNTNLHSTRTEIVFVGPDPTTALMVERMLDNHACVIDRISNNYCIKEAIYGDACDLLILDLTAQATLELLQYLRRHGLHPPILAVLPDDGLDQRVCVLDQGADVILTKPFAEDELRARIHALLRRRAMQMPPAPLTFGRLCLSPDRRRVWIDGVPLDLTPRELGLLNILIKRADRMVTRAQIVSSLCHWNQGMTNNSIEIVICRLRQRLANSGLSIRTIRNVGYVLERETNHAIFAGVSISRNTAIPTNSRPTLNLEIDLKRMSYINDIRPLESSASE